METKVMTEKISELFIQSEQNKSVPGRIEHLLQMVGSVNRLADLAGVSETTIRKWKSGESEPTVSRLVRLARCTGVDVGWLATGEKPKSDASREPTLTCGGDKPPEHIYIEGFSPEQIEGVVLLVERHEQTRTMPPEAKARFIRELLENQEAANTESRKIAQEILKKGPPQPKE